MSIKRLILMLPAIIVGLALIVTPAVRSAAAEEGGAAAAAHGESHTAGGHGSEMDERLVPIPPSKDTIATSIWVIVIFVIMLVILYPTAWKNVLVGLKKREERIRKDIADAEATRAKAEATLREYNAQLAAAEARVREMISSATTEGERIATQIKMQAQQEAEATKDRAVKDIDAARRQALQDIYAQAAELSTRIAEKILRRNLNADDQRDLVNQSLEQLQTVEAR
jgi:F-type H+-transporting ATPase subunit b